MANCLQVENLTKAFGERVLFEGITFGIEQGEKVALIAVNGAGKTTLLNIIAGQEDYQSGQITFRRDIRVGYLQQNPTFPPQASVLETCFAADAAIAAAIARYEAALRDGVELDAAMVAMDAAGAWDREQQAKEILTRLGFTDLTQAIGELSGGQVKRLALAQVLIAKSDLLILDEPTNHLDLEMTEWLEEYLSTSRTTLLMVTHDRYFLDRVCNRILEIDEKAVYGYKGNYSYYIEKRQERIDTANATAERTRNLYRRELEWIRSTPQARTGKAKYRIDAFESLSAQRMTASTQRQVQIGIEASRIGTKIFEMKALCKRFGDKVILRDFDYLFTKGEKLGIIGHNGVGKSTFVKMLLGEVAPDSGTVDVGTTVRFGYYSQNGLAFSEQERVIDVVKKISEDIALSDGRRLSASQFLQQFLFSPAAQYDLVAKLSGGERRRLYLCTVLISNPNFLILDEPTNDLDIQTLRILEEYLYNYAGCAIIVSHDRFFMDRVVDHLFVMEGDGVVRNFPGNYTDYRCWKREQQAAAGQQAKAEKPKSQPAPAPRPANNNAARLTFNEKRELEQLNAELPQLEARKKELETAMSSGTMSVDALMKASAEITDLIRDIDLKSDRWLVLSEKS